jgi:hypothetical protein
MDPDENISLISIGTGSYCTQLQLKIIARIVSNTAR